MKSLKNAGTLHTYLFIAATAIQLYVFKYFYPRSDFTLNSYNYIQDAISKANFGLWPIGYSKFLYFIHTIARTDTIVVISQYVILQASAFAFFISVQKFYSPPTHIKNTIFVILIFNPSSLFISNYILPDALFAAVSLLWAANLIWIINNPNAANIVSHTISLPILLILKTQGLFYPVVSAITIIFINRGWLFKYCALILMLTTTLTTVEAVKKTAQKETGKRQLSAIMSWQLANNALYGYPYIDTTNLTLAAETGQLQNGINQYFSNNKDPITPLYGSAYLYAYLSPLRQYWLNYVLRDKNTTERQGWCQLAPTVHTWGVTVIQANPWSYVRYYFLPNTVNYFFPLIHEVSTYNGGNTNVNLMVKEWFEYPTTTITCRFPELQGKVFIFFSAMFLIINVIVIFGIIFLIIKKHIPNKETKTWRQFLIFGTFFYGTNACFSIALQPVDITSMMFPIVEYLCFILIILSLLIKVEPRLTPDQPIK